MKVALFGTQTEVIHIFISVNKLAGMSIDPKQLAGLLQSQNQIINTGEISAGEQQLRIVANGTYTTVDDIRNQVITTSGGQVKLGDIASLKRDTWNLPAISCTSMESAPSVSASPPTDKGCGKNR